MDMSSMSSMSMTTPTSSAMSSMSTGDSMSGMSGMSGMSSSSAMASMSTGHSMSGMSGSMGGMSGGMAMTFTNSHSTPLFSEQWTPQNSGQYAGTCIFLLVLAIISRLLLAYRHHVEQRWRDRAVARRYVFVADDKESQPKAGVKGDGQSEEAILTTNGLNERVRIVTSAGRRLETPPWRFTTDLPRAGIFTVQAGVGYLLMLAVMTLNIGYFLCTLAGLFIGELMVGRFTPLEDAHH